MRGMPGGTPKAQVMRGVPDWFGLSGDKGFESPLAYRAVPRTARPPTRRCNAMCVGGPRIYQRRN
ncbi:hypothetical protein GCM10010518_59750 [Kitasatospora cinereorecta]